MFLFCEICFRRPQSTGNLLISSCRHLFCRRCANSVTNCSLCKQPCRIIELRQDKLPEPLKDYFASGTDLLAKAVKVISFHLDKQDAFIANKIGLLEKYEAKKLKFQKLKEHYESLKKAIDEEVAIMRRMRQQRKSPGILNISPAGPVYVRSQPDSLRVSTLKKVTPTSTLKRSRASGSNSSTSSDLGSGGGTRFDPSNSQVSNVSSSKRFTPTSKSGSYQSPKLAGSARERKPLVSPIETFKKPTDLATTARAGIYREAIRNINDAMKRLNQPVLKVSNRGSDIERARNVLF
ncbi:zip homologous protein 2-like [Topomyia yanbarensis]|uniref:zip homologous protein 2-like n=1 Tax=Topomyia yanbarensis TaxID=2498891 RepID=UPI00273C2CC8|nr:zip homologous protein 2-like [Topomyia yanbarensis]